MIEEKAKSSILNYIQCNLSAPKNQKNKFGNYNYRSCEDILEALKPLLNGAGCHLTVSDEVKMVGDRFYVVSVASLYYGDATLSTSTGFAREAATKKGMDESQITGAASSYARKSALSGMFLIDDTRDADSTNDGPEKATPNESKPRVAHSVQVKKAVSAINACTTIDQLKETYSKSKDYFKKWSQPGHVETITKAKDAMKLKIGGQ